MLAKAKEKGPINWIEGGVYFVYDNQAYFIGRTKGASLGIWTTAAQSFLGELNQ